MGIKLVRAWVKILLVNMAKNKTILFFLVYTDAFNFPWQRITKLIGNSSFYSKS